MNLMGNVAMPEHQLDQAGASKGHLPDSESSASRAALKEPKARAR